MKKAIILQAFGLGDIIFTQTIAHHFISQGYEITWPVEDLFLDGLKKAYPDINWISEKESPVPLSYRKQKVYKGFLVIPIRFSNTITGTPYKYVMRAKYDMYQLDWNTWTDKALWVRNKDKEKELADIVGATGEYRLVNCNFNGAKERVIQIPTSNTIKTIEMSFVDGFSLFDWAYVIENASEISTVSTSIIYLLELLKIKCVPKLYIRRPIEGNHDFYDYLLKRHEYELMP